MKKYDKTLIVLVIALILSGLGNVYALSHYFGKQTVVQKHEKLSQQKTHDADESSFRDLALSLSPEGRKILATAFVPHLPKIMAARSILKEKHQVTKIIVNSENFTKEQFLDAVAEMGGAQQKYQSLVKDLFVEAVIALPEQDRKTLAKNYRKVVLSSLRNEIQE